MYDNVPQQMHSLLESCCLTAYHAPGTRSHINSKLWINLCVVVTYSSHVVLHISITMYQEADENGSDGLDIDEFRAAFGQILGKGKNDQQMAIMFMKIDTNCDGTVDWVCIIYTCTYLHTHRVIIYPNIEYDMHRLRIVDLWLYKNRCT